MPTTKWSKEDVARWAEMYAERMTLDEISAATGVPMVSIHYRLRKAGVAMRRSCEDSKSPIERFSKLFTPEPNTGCWLWLRGTSAFGYGIFHHAGLTTAHRVSYHLHVGPIPDGISVLHKCDVPQCVNPDHLFLGTHADNMKDMAAKGRAQRHCAEKTHCPHGHPYDDENTRIKPNGKWRSCRACARISASAFRQKHIERYRAYDRARYWREKEEGK